MFILRYMKEMKKWFKMISSKEDFDFEVRKFINKEQLRAHNHLLLQLFTVCDGLADAPPSPAEYKALNAAYLKRKRQHSTCFQPANVLEYVCDDNHFTGNDDKSFEQPTPYFQQEKCLLDESMLFGRLTHCAWENNLDGALMDSAQLLAVAVQNFLKNVVTAILSERNGYKVKENSFIYEMGTTVPNPWLRSASKWNEPQLITSRVAAKKNSANLIGLDLGLGFEPDCEPLNRGQIEQNIIYASSKINPKRAKNSKRPKITIQEVLNALRLNRSVILSRTVYFASMERLIGRHEHPSWGDDPEMTNKSKRIKRA
ncbi:transcriptional adapter 1-like isoform X2 [Lycorma delicatula]|uniref:transcriptional adapter 1-like isoform X2 n=1 Tax=Lycorma delicatula TaxID=130591 RepID=UPI003F5129E7